MVFDFCSIRTTRFRTRISFDFTDIVNTSQVYFQITFRFCGVRTTNFRTRIVFDFTNVMNKSQVHFQTTFGFRSKRTTCFGTRKSRNISFMNFSYMPVQTAICRQHSFTNFTHHHFVLYLQILIAIICSFYVLQQALLDIFREEKDDIILNLFYRNIIRYGY